MEVACEHARPEVAGKLPEPSLRPVGDNDSAAARWRHAHHLANILKEHSRAILLSAVRFICHAVKHSALHELRQRRAVPRGFIHLPYDTRQAVRHLCEPSMSFDLTIEAARTAIGRLLRLRIARAFPGGSSIWLIASAQLKAGRHDLASDQQ
jgi:hypothetical protein